MSTLTVDKEESQKYVCPLIPMHSKALDYHLKKANH